MGACTSVLLPCDFLQLGLFMAWQAVDFDSLDHNDDAFLDLTEFAPFGLGTRL